MIQTKTWKYTKQNCEKILHIIFLTRDEIDYILILFHFTTDGYWIIMSLAGTSMKFTKNR